MNPYLCTDGGLFQDAASAGYHARRPDGDAIYRIDFTHPGAPWIHVWSGAV